jgi:hypothetical protein
MIFPTLNAKDREAIEKRLSRLEKLEPEAERAADKFGEVAGGRQHLIVRRAFVVRPEEGLPQREASDRSLPPRPERPPATRLTSPRGIALRFYLIALFLAQSRSPGEKPRNLLPLRDPDAPVSWVDLVATPAERARGGLTSVSIPEKKLRQVHDALKRLAGEDADLVSLPNRTKPVRTYEGFLLQNESGARYLPTQPLNGPYTVPSKKAETLRLPAGLFKNGWIHVLEDSELTMLLMIASLHADYPLSPYVYVEGDIRLTRYGVGRDAYQSHQLLESLGLIEVEEDLNRRRSNTPGKVAGYTPTDPPKLHRFCLLPSGFQQPAIAKMRQVLEARRDM